MKLLQLLMRVILDVSLAVGGAVDFFIVHHDRNLILCQVNVKFDSVSTVFQGVFKAFKRVFRKFCGIAAVSKNFRFNFHKKILLTCQSR